MNPSRPSIPNPHDIADTTRADLVERLKELDCLYRVAAIFADRGDSIDESLQRVVCVLAEACRFPESAVAELTLDETAARFPVDATLGGGARIRAAICVSGRQRGELSLRYRDTATGRTEIRDATSCELFIGEEQALLDAVAHQVGVFVGGAEADQRRREMEASLWHADRLATIGQLASGVAHELNEPLGNVLGFAQLAQKSEGVPESVLRDLGHIADAALRGREIVRKLLLFARQTPASKRPTEINPVVEEALFLLEAGCENPGIRFIRELGSGLPRIEADPLQIRQVITNLVINAMQSIETSGTVTVITASDGDMVALTVSDTGAGMSEDVQRRLFDPFFTTKDVGDGTGLGLSIVQGIVAEHAGTIGVQSEHGGGSTFRVLLPASGGTGDAPEGGVT